MSHFTNMIKGQREIYQSVLDLQRKAPLELRTPHTFIHDEGKLVCPNDLAQDSIMVVACGKINGTVFCPVCKCEVPVVDTRPENKEALPLAEAVKIEGTKDGTSTAA